MDRIWYYDVVGCFPVKFPADQWTQEGSNPLLLFLILSIFTSLTMFLYLISIVYKSYSLSSFSEIFRNHLSTAKFLLKWQRFMNLQPNPSSSSGGVEMRWVDTYFPFTNPSFELEIYFQVYFCITLWQTYTCFCFPLCPSSLDVKIRRICELFLWSHQIVW